MGLASKKGERSTLAWSLAFASGSHRPKRNYKEGEKKGGVFTCSCCTVHTIYTKPSPRNQLKLEVPSRLTCTDSQRGRLLDSFEETEPTSKNLKIKKP